MPTQWILFLRTRPRLGLITRCWRRGGRITTYLSLLLLLGLGIPAPATALQFDSYSLSAFVEPIPGTTRASASFTATAQDFHLRIGFHDQLIGPPFGDVARLGCFSFDPTIGASIPHPCRPGDSVSAFARQGGSNEDLRASMVLGGQTIPGCVLGHTVPGLGPLCVNPHVFGLSWGSSGPLPLFAGAPPGHPVPAVPADILNVTTVAGAFSVGDVGASIIQGITPIDSVNFGGDFVFGPPLTGPAQFVLEWQPDTGTWLPLFAEGRFDLEPTPEPAILLLFGTTAAGLGLARWLRRRGREGAHAA
jgi:hypothetical protein